VIRKKILAVQILTLVIVLSLSLGLYACGGASPSPTPAAAAGPKATSAPQTAAPVAAPAKLTGKPIKVGYMTPLSGRMVANGLLQQVAVQLAVEDINAAGGINGNPLEVVTFDSPFDPQQAVTGVRKLIEQDKVFAVLGPYASGEVEAAGPIANQLQTPLIASSASKSSIFPQNRPWVFGFLAPDEVGIPVAIDGYKKVYPNAKRMVITGDTKESVTENAIRNIFPKALKEKGFDVIDTVPYETGTTDFSAIVTKIKGLNPDGVVVCDVSAPGIAKELERQQVKAPVVTGFWIQPTPFLATVGSAGEGWVGVRVINVEDPDPTLQKFLARYNERVKAGNIKIDQLSLEAGAYDALMRIAEIMRANNITADSSLQQARTTIRDGIASLKNWKGLYTNISMTESGQVTFQTYAHVAKNGKWQLIK